MDLKQQSLLFDIRENIKATQIQRRSEYYDEYMKFFLNFPQQISNEASIIASLEQQLKKHNILKKSNLYQPFSLSIVFCSSNYEVVEIELSWGYYMMRAEILNKEGQSIFHACKSSSGANAKIYHLTLEQNNFSIKCIKTKSSQNQSISAARIKVFKEYFIFRIASALGIGPIISKNYLGFDLILSEQCIQFPMQTCEQLKNLSKQAILDLKKSLLIFHFLKIVHFDLKPENLMWSNNLKHEVFIDFGLSQIVKGGPGIKYPIKFKGSPNYCSYQMTSLMISPVGGYVDIYYNDVYCLNETIRVITISSFQPLELDGLSFSQQAMDLHVHDNYHQDYKEKYQYQNIFQRRWLKITQLKKFIYSGNSQKIDFLFQDLEYKSLLYEGQILDFIRTNCPTFYLKQFYQKYIPDSIRESIENGWIEDWAKSVYPKTMTLSQQVLSQESSFYSLYLAIKNISTLKVNDFDSLTRLELEQLLLKEKVDDLQAYFYCFLSYISFLNNIHKVGSEEKLKFCRYFLKLLVPQFLIPLNTGSRAIQQDLLQCLAYICKFILKYFLSSDMRHNQSKLDNQKRIQLILNILEHIYFFALLETEESIDLLEQIYSMSVWSQLDRFHIIMAVVNHNSWNLISLFSEKNISSQRVEVWFRDKLQKLGKEQLQPQCRFIYEIFELQPKYKINIIKDSRFKQLPSQLKMQYLLTQLPRQFVIMKQYPILQISRFISENFPRSQKNRLLSIYFYFFGIFNIGYGNIQQSESICELFKRNLLSPYLFQKFIFVRISRIQLITTVEGKIKQITHFTRIINRPNVGLLIQILGRQLINLFEKIQNITLGIFKYSLGGKELLNQLQIMTEKLSFKNYIGAKTHIRQNLGKNDIFNYFTLKSKIYFLNRIPYTTISSDLAQLQQFINNTACTKCYIYLTYQLLRVRIQGVIINLPQNPVGRLIQYLNAYLQFRRVNKQFDGLYSHNLIYASVIGKLLILRCHDERLFKIMHQYYKYSKKNQLIENYMDSIEIPKFLAFSLIAILQLESFEEMICCLSATFSYLHYTENTFTLYPMIDNYMSFLLSPNIRNPPGLIDEILQAVHMRFRNEAYVAAFYYSYLKTVQQPQEIYQYLKKVCLLIKFMPLKISFYFEALVYFYIIEEKSQIWKKATLCPYPHLNQSREFRKKVKMTTKLTKLLYCNQNDHSNVRILQAKVPKTRCRNMKVLWMKCRKLGAFEFIDYPQRVIKLKVKSQ